MFLPGGSVAVFLLVLLAEEETGHLSLGSVALGDIAVTAGLAGSGLNLGAALARRSARAPANTLGSVGGPHW